MRAWQAWWRRRLRFQHEEHEESQESEAFAIFVLFVLKDCACSALELCNNRALAPLPAWVPAFAGMSGGYDVASPAHLR
jgi:hypothetical protein